MFVFLCVLSYQLHHAAQVFADDVEFQIYHTSYVQRVEISMFEGIWDDRYLERVLHRVTYGQAHPVDGYRAFVYGKVSAFRHFGLEIILRVGNHT